MTKILKIIIFIILFQVFNYCETFAQKYVYSGIVRDSVLNETLPYATITLTDLNSKTLEVGVSGENGRFRIESNQKADSIKLSYINYRPYVKAIDLTDFECNLGTLHISNNEARLNEVIVNAKSVSYSVDKNSYFVTNKMRQGSLNAIELLDKST